MNARLGILVVYVVTDGFEKLLEIHLDRIRRHATLPYTIYGALTRVSAASLEILERRDDVKLFRFPETDARGAEEHSWYLEQLVTAAVADGTTHLAILHVDSFPVRDGWDGELTRKLSERCVFASLPGINTACLVFDREFHLEYRPAFLLSPEVEQSTAYQKYLEAAKPNLHSGIGYGFRAWSEGLTWLEIEETTREDDESGASIYGGLIFHLKGSVRLATPPEQEPPRVVSVLGRDRFERILSLARAIIPTSLRGPLRRMFRRSLESAIDDSRVRWDASRMTTARERLFEDPDGYIDQLAGSGSS